MMAESPIVLKLSRVEICPKNRCPACKAVMAVHQPDPELPDRLIATCGDCRTWFLIYCDADVHLRLPREDEVQPS